MSNKESLFNAKIRLKHIHFLSFTIPLLLTLWFTLIVFGDIINPAKFINLPENMRNEHLTSLFFRIDSWNYPISLTKNIGAGIPLSLTDSIPLMAIIFKLFRSEFQYFGLWMILSFILTAFLGYRISLNITGKRVLAGLGSLLCVTIPFLWIQSSSTFWLAGQWTILWAYSLFFKKKAFISYEWFWVIIISALIHPFFAFVCFFIMVSDIFQLYLYKHSISVVKAASAVSHAMSVAIITLTISGLFYLPTLYTPIQKPAYISSDLNLGYGILIASIIIFISAIFFPKTPKYIRYYKPLISTLLLFLVFSLFGGVVINGMLIELPVGNWIQTYIFGIYTSGFKFLLPILWLFPIIIIHASHLLEKYKNSLGIVFLSCVVLTQLIFSEHLEKKYNTPFQELPQEIQEFLNHKKELVWIFQDNIPLTPNYYDKFAYYAYFHKMRINAAHVFRFPTDYVNLLNKDRDEFMNSQFNTNAVYIVNKSDLSPSFEKKGKIAYFHELALFQSN